MIEFKPVISMQGFDRDQTPRWQMVPVGGHRFVALGDGAGATLTSANAAIATVAEVPLTDVPNGNRAPLVATDRVFKVSAARWGNTRLQAKNAAGVVMAELEIDTKNRKTVQLAFNFVSDNAGHSTRRSTADVTAWIRSINAIYQGQTNITFRVKSSRNVTVAQNLGQVVRFSSHVPGVPAAQHEWAVVTALRDATADMNIFLVWEYEQDNSPLSDSTDAGTLSNNCIFEDSAGSQTAETLSHEIGHYLGCPDHYNAARRRELMYGITDTRGVHIPKQAANIMNP